MEICYRYNGNIEYFCFEEFGDLNMNNVVLYYDIYY